MTGQAGLHWHAYGYLERSPKDVEAGLFPSSLDGSAWLAGPARDILATFEDPEDAAAWMKDQLSEHPPLDPVDTAYVHASVYTRHALVATPHLDVHALYEDKRGRTVLRLLVPCPRPQVEHWPRRIVPPCPKDRP